MAWHVYRLILSFVQLLPALDYVELDFRKAWNAGNKDAALVLTGETVKHKFFS